MEQFSLEKWLQDKSRKVITRDGRIVEILKVDAKGNHPIIGIYQFSDTEDMESSWRIDGRKTENGESFLDLFFADEEELTEFEKELQIIISEASHWTSDDGSISTYCQFGDKEIKKISAQVLDLTRKEILKDFPKWKKCVGSTGPFIDDFKGEDYLYLKDYVIKVSELFEKLPKEE